MCFMDWNNFHLIQILQIDCNPQSNTKLTGLHHLCNPSQDCGYTRKLRPLFLHSCKVVVRDGLQFGSSFVLLLPPSFGRSVVGAASQLRQKCACTLIKTGFSSGGLFVLRPPPPLVRIPRQGSRILLDDVGARLSFIELTLLVPYKLLQDKLLPSQMREYRFDTFRDSATVSTITYILLIFLAYHKCIYP